MADSDLPPLSEREMEILRLVTTGATNQEIASKLVISPYTVKTHLKNIFAKLEVATRTEATMVAVRRGWVDVPQSGGQAAPTAVPEEAPATPPSTVAAAALPVLERWPRVPRIQRAILVVALALALVVVFLPQIVARRSSGKAQGAIGGVFPTPTGAPASTTGKWSTRAQMPTPRNGLAVAAHEGLMYAIGGVSNDGVTGKVEVYDPATDAWTARRAKPMPVGFVSAAGAGGKIYVPGGVGAEQVDPETSWRSTIPGKIPGNRRRPCPRRWQRTGWPPGTSGSTSSVGWVSRGTSARSIATIPRPTGGRHAGR